MKNNLLDDCNDQHIPPAEFQDIFCKRCRNPDCVNAGWARSTFEDRVRTQVDRLLVNPVRARPDDTRFDPLRAMHFTEVPAELSLARLRDPWAGPGVHLADPPPVMATSQVVEAAVSRLAEVRGQRPPAPTAIAVETEVVRPVPQAPVPQAPVPQAPVPQAPVPQAPIPPADQINTDFPEEGVMLGGSPVDPAPVLPPVDPWAPKPKMNVVPRGAKIRMDG